MKQYCRYCAFCIETDGYYCTDHCRFIADSSIKSANNCKEFAYCGMDIITGKDHEPKDYQQRRRKTNDGEQIRMEVGKSRLYGKEKYRE